MIVFTVAAVQMKDMKDEDAEDWGTEINTETW